MLRPLVKGWITLCSSGLFTGIGLCGHAHPPDAKEFLLFRLYARVLCEPGT